jgi:serine/threonine protein kinase
VRATPSPQILVHRRTDNVPFVVKKVNLQGLPEKERTEAAVEVQVLALLAHPHVVAYFSSFVQKNALHIVLEFCDAGDLSQQIEKAKRMRKPFKEGQIIVWFAQIVAALYYVHSKNILHRDLKVHVCPAGRRVLHARPGGTGRSARAHARMARSCAPLIAPLPLHQCAAAPLHH